LSTSGTNGKEGFDGTSGTTGTSGSSGSSSITKSETPIGIIDGVNKIFTLLEIPTNPAAVIVIQNGVTQYNGIDYSFRKYTTMVTVLTLLNLICLLQCINRWRIFRKFRKFRN
jgi:hypothetical protein